MAETGKTRRKPGSTTPPTHEPVKLGEIPALDDQTLNALFSWLHTVDDVKIAGHQNKLPRWVYVVALLWLIF